MMHFLIKPIPFPIFDSKNITGKTPLSKIIAEIILVKKESKNAMLFMGEYLWLSQYDM